MYQSIFRESGLEWKVAQATGTTTGLKGLSGKVSSRREWIVAGVRVPHTDFVRKGALTVAFVIWSHCCARDNIRSILPGLRRNRTGLLLCGPKSSFHIKVNFAFHLEINVLESAGSMEMHRIQGVWSSVWSFGSLWWFGKPCHLLVLVVIGTLGLIKSRVHAVYQEFSEHFPLPSAKSFMEMLIVSWHLPKLIANDLPQTSTTQRIYRAIQQHSNHFCIVNPLLIYLRTYSNNLLYTISLFCNLHIYAVIYGILSNRQRFLPILQWTIMLLEKTAVMMWCSEFFISRWRHSWLLHKSIIKQILSVLLGKLWRNLVCLKKQTYSNWQQDLWAFPFMPAGLVSLRISGLDIRITVLHDKKKKFYSM